MPPDHSRQPLDTASLHAQFPMLAVEPRRFFYLDSAASSQTPTRVLDAVDSYYRTCRANVHRGMYRASEEATVRYEAVRGTVASLLRAREQDIIFTSGTTHGLNLAAQLLAPRVHAGDEIVVSEMEHHANLIPWQQLAKARGAVLRYLPVGEDFELDLAAARQIIGPKTRVLAVTWASNVLGTVNQVAELCALAKAHGAYTVVDAAQVVGHLPIDVTKLEADFLAFSGHKMLGPTGVGVLYGRHELTSTLEPVSFGGDMITNVTYEGASWNEAPLRFEPGTPNIAGVIGLGEACRMVQEIGPDAAHAHEKQLIKHAFARLAEVPGVTVFGPGADRPRVGAISFNLAGIHAHDVATVLDAGGVCVRAGHHCAMPLHRKFGLTAGTARMSFGVYTDEADVDALINGLHKARQIFRV
jgi:cysteine desulfurase/selenocysteine lyase